MSDYSDFSFNHGGFPDIYIYVKYPILSRGMMTLFSFISPKNSPSLVLTFGRTGVIRVVEDIFRVENPASNKNNY